MTIWNLSNQEKIAWIEKFKDIFIYQKKHQLGEIFSDDFGTHNGLSMDEYCDYEFAEFYEKHLRFDLTAQASILAYDILDDYFYFSLGNIREKAVFEAIFQWDKKTGKARGNQYPFKVEPKIQFFQTISPEQLSPDFTQARRRINFTPLHDVTLKNVIVQTEADNFLLVGNSLPAHLGGSFYSFIYEKEQDDYQTFWDISRISTSHGLIKLPILMRGKDHPLFIDNLFPVMQSTHSFTVEKEIYPVVINIVFDDDSETYFKYPLEKTFQFEKNIKQVCLTDALSFDWIVNLH
jgi:hypothetical protein